ncbi:hypothetical protein BUZ45_11540 [Staphylococcus hominis]|nr:hypothetical protein BUZ45_11540 [Staphylococcus hominis]
MHVAVPSQLSLQPRPGDIVTATVTHGAPFHLVADSALNGGLFEVTRTRAGDAWERSEQRKEELLREAAGQAPVKLGIPTIGLRPLS